MTRIFHALPHYSSNNSAHNIQPIQPHISYTIEQGSIITVQTLVKLTHFFTLNIPFRKDIVRKHFIADTVRLYTNCTVFITSHKSVDDQRFPEFIYSQSFQVRTATTMKVPLDVGLRRRVPKLGVSNRKSNFKTRFKNGLREASVQFCMESTMHGFQKVCLSVQMPATSKWVISMMTGATKKYAFQNWF